MSSGLLCCSRPYEGQPKTGVAQGRCELCGHAVIYDPANLKRVIAIHGAAQIACIECVDTIIRVEPQDIAKVVGMVEGEEISDMETFQAIAKANRAAHGGSK